MHFYFASTMQSAMTKCLCPLRGLAPSGGAGAYTTCRSGSSRNEIHCFHTAAFQRVRRMRPKTMAPASTGSTHPLRGPTESVLDTHFRQVDPRFRLGASDLAVDQEHAYLQSAEIDGYVGNVDPAAADGDVLAKSENDSSQQVNTAQASADSGSGERGASAGFVEAAIGRLFGRNQPDMPHSDTSTKSRPRARQIGRRTWAAIHDMETEWRKTQGKYRIRHRLTESLDSRRKYEVVSREENSKNEATAACAPHRSILVRNFEHTIRKCDAFDDTVAVASTPAQSNVESVLLAAWIQYKTIREHADSDMLLKQIRTNSIALFITELNFAPSSLEYRQRFDQIIHIVNDFTKIGRPITNHVLFGIYLRALNKVGKHRLVFKAIPEFCSYANSPGETILLPNILRQLIVAYFGVGRADKAMEAFEMLREDESHKSNLTPHVYTALICGAIRAGHLPDGKILDLVDELLALLCQPKWTGAARTGVLNELLDAVKYSANRALYFSVFDKFASQGISSNYATFGIFLKSLRFLRPNTSQMHGIYRALISHEQSRNAMTRHIFGVFINNFVHTGMISNALAALQDMRDHPTAKPTVLNMSLLFSHYASAGLPEPSLSLYHTMVNADKLAPTWVTYMSIVKAIVKGGNLAAATEISGMSGAVGGSTEAKAKQFDALLTVLIKTGEVGDFDSMFGAFRKMRVLAPDSLMPFVAVFVRSYFIAKQRARLVRCGPEAATGLGAGVPDDDENRRFVGLLRTCLEDLFGVLARQPAIRDLYNMAISTFATLRDYESTQRAYDHMTKVKHLEPNYRTFNVLIQAYVRNFDLATATNVLQELKDSEVPLNHVTLNVLTRGYVKAGLVDKAIDTYAYMVGRPAPLLESAKFEDFLPCAKPDDYFYAFFISALIDAKRYREAIVVFEDSFAILPFVPRQLLETLVSRLEESSEFDLSLTCLNRYTKRVESCQPTSGQPAASDGKHIASPEPTCDRHPVSYFGYSLDRGSLD